MSLRLLRRLRDRAALRQRSCASAPGRPLVLVMEKLRQLLAQAFIPFGLVAEHDSSLEQSLLKLARKLAPQIEGSQS